MSSGDTLTANGVPNRSLLRRMIIPISLIAICGAIELVNWTTDFTSETLIPQFGESSKAVLGRGIVLIFGGLLLFWLLLTRQVRRRTKAVVFGLVALVAAGLAASIRSIENGGNNNLVIHWRWEPTRDQRLEAYQQAVQPRVDAASEPSSEVFALDTAAPQFTDFLGANRDGIVPGVRLVTDLAATKPREVWRRPVGESYAGFVIAGGLAVTIEQRGDQETIVAMDMVTGVDRWARGYEGYFQESLGGNGPRATPTIAGNEVFALGATGLLVSLDLATGQEKWKTNILTDAGAENIMWGMSGAPLVVDDLVIVNPGGADNAELVAYDRATGQKRWSSGQDKAGYSSPILTTLCDVRQVLIFDATGIAGHDLATGKSLWRYPFPTFNGINAGQPLVLPDNQVFISSGYDAGSVLLQIANSDEQWSADPLWKSRRMKCKMGSAIYHDGYLYGLDDGILTCLDAKTGTRQWKAGRYGHGQILLRNDVLVIMAEKGDLVLVALNPKEHVELSSMPALPGGKTWNAPALADNQLLLRNHFEAVLLELAVQ